MIAEYIDSIRVVNSKWFSPTAALTHATSLFNESLLAMVISSAY